MGRKAHESALLEFSNLLDGKTRLPAITAGTRGCYEQKNVSHKFDAGFLWPQPLHAGNAALDNGWFRSQNGILAIPGDSRPNLYVALSDVVICTFLTPSTKAQTHNRHRLTPTKQLTNQSENSFAPVNLQLKTHTVPMTAL